MRKTLLIALMTGGLVMGATTSIYAKPEVENLTSPGYVDSKVVIPNDTEQEISGENQNQSEGEGPYSSRFQGSLEAVQ